MREIWAKGSMAKYKKGEIILKEDERFNKVYILLMGKAIQYKATHHGRRKIFFVLGPGSLLNDDVFKNHACSIDCEAIEPCIVFDIPKEDLWKVMEADFSLVQGLMYEQEFKIWRLFQQLKDTGSSIQIERRMAVKLCRLADEFGIETDVGREIDINMSMSFLADLMGTPRETASRLCKDLVDHGLILHERKRITVCDSQGLINFYETGDIDSSRGT